jgi:hypothetical protein
MAQRLSELGSRELLDRVANDELGEGEVLEVLRNPHCTIEIAERIVNTPGWLTSHVVRERLAAFRGMPLSRSLNLLQTLPWLSLLHLAQLPQTPPMIRRQAERRLLARITTMTLGEKVAVARRAHRPLFRRLIANGDESVLVALLDNPRLVETDVLVIINTGSPSAGFFTTVARHSRWGERYPVRQALAECPHAPLAVALAALVQLKVTDIARAARKPDLTEKVRAAAWALVEKRRFNAEANGGTILR